PPLLPARLLRHRGARSMRGAVCFGRRRAGSWTRIRTCPCAPGRSATRSTQTRTSCARCCEASTSAVRQALLRELRHGDVVRLAVRCAADRIDEEDALRRLEPRQPGTDVLAEVVLAGRGAAVRLDEADDGLAPLLVRHTDVQRVVHGRVGLERLLDLFGIDLLAAGVDADAAAAEEHERAVVFDHAPVAGDDVPDAPDRLEGAGGLLRVLVVAEGNRAAVRDEARLAAPGADLAAVLGEDLDPLAQLDAARP